MALRHPTRDGEWVTYRPNHRHRFRGDVQIWFVNGILTFPSKFALAANAIARDIGHAVDGLYNATGNSLTGAALMLIERIRRDASLRRHLLDMDSPIDRVRKQIDAFGVKHAIHAAEKVTLIAGLPADLAKCITDWLAPKRYDDAVAERTKTGRGLSAQQRRELGQELVGAGSLATQNMYARLAGETSSGRTIAIVCHSHGTIVTRDALRLLDFVRGHRAVGNIYVYALATAVPRGSWPSGVQLRAQVHNDDWIRICELFSEEPSGTGGHSLESYRSDGVFQRQMRDDLGFTRLP